jgi:hypothetical protein
MVLVLLSNLEIELNYQINQTSKEIKMKKSYRMATTKLFSAKGNLVKAVQYNAVSGLYEVISKENNATVINHVSRGIQDCYSKMGEIVSEKLTHPEYSID